MDRGPIIIWHLRAENTLLDNERLDFHVTNASHRPKRNQRAIAVGHPPPRNVEDFRAPITGPFSAPRDTFGLRLIPVALRKTHTYFLTQSFITLGKGNRGIPGDDRHDL